MKLMYPDYVVLLTVLDTVIGSPARQNLVKEYVNRRDENCPLFNEFLEQELTSEQFQLLAAKLRVLG